MMRKNEDGSFDGFLGIFSPDLPQSLPDELLIHYFRRLTIEQFKLFQNLIFEVVRPVYEKAYPYIDSHATEPEMENRIKELERRIAELEKKK